MVTYEKTLTLEDPAFDEPVLVAEVVYSELDDRRYELRQIRRNNDGSLDYAGRGKHSRQCLLCELPLPTIAFMKAMPETAGSMICEEMSATEFEELWSQAVASQIALRGDLYNFTMRELTAADLPVVDSWFDDSETQHWLGGPGWAKEGLRLAGPDRYNLLAYADLMPAALVDVKVGEDKRAAFAIVVNPQIRGRGIGRAVVGMCLEDPRFAEVSEWFAGVETGNVASAQLLLSCGFTKMTDIDADGFSYFAWRRFGWPELPWRTPWAPPADRARRGPAMSKLGGRTTA